MQLNYRAAQYEMAQYERISPIVAAKQNQTIGMYRGTTFAIRFLQVEQQFQSVIRLKYRGVAYSGLR